MAYKGSAGLVGIRRGTNPPIGGPVMTDVRGWNPVRQDGDEDEEEGEEDEEE